MISEDISCWTVLIVDDDRDNVAIPDAILTHLRAAVYTASNGEEGLRVLESMIPTLVLLDLSMPVMDGWATLEEIRRHKETAHLPVIAVTAHAMKGDEDSIRAAGFDGYIGKPYMIDEFLAEIKQCVTEECLRVNRHKFKEMSRILGEVLLTKLTGIEAVDE